MRNYELMLLVDPEVDERTVEPTLNKFLEVVKKAEAIYAVVNFTAEPQTASELDRVLGLNESIMRTKIIRPEDQRIK